MSQCDETCKSSWHTLQDQFATEIHDRAAEVDLENELHWFELTYGWALGKGMSIDDAFYFALHIRYHTDLG